MVLLNLCMKFEIFWAKSTMKQETRKNIQNMSQGPPNPGFMQEKVQKGDFLKIPSRELNFLLLFQVPMNLLKAWNAKLEMASFLLSKIIYKQCVM